MKKNSTPYLSFVAGASTNLRLSPLHPSPQPFSCRWPCATRTCAPVTRVGARRQNANPNRRGPGADDPSLFLSDDDDLADPELYAAARAAAISAETLSLLDWPALSRHVAKFATTQCGKAALVSPGIPVPPRRVQSELLLAQTRAALFLLVEKGVGLDFAGVRDVENKVKYAAKGGVLAVDDLLNIVSTIEAGRKIKIVVTSFAEDFHENIYPLLTIVEDFQTYRKTEREVFAKIDEGAMTVRASASPKLAGIRENIYRLEAGIKEVLNDIISSKPEALQDRVIAKRYDRLVLAVKAGMKTRVSGIVHDTSATGSTLFIEPKAAADMNAKLRQVRKKEEDEIQRILQELTDLVAADSAGILRMLRRITDLDVATARAKHGIAIGAVEPKFIRDEAEPVDMPAVRHPLLVWNEMDYASRGPKGRRDPGGGTPGAATQIRIRDAKLRVVPTDYLLGRKIKCAIITGPNTGGKTISLKTFGVAVLMARAGLYVLADADEVRMPYFDLVLADIGDEQSITQSLSTFSGHIQRVKKILHVATKDSLVLLDEVGSGTDPAEGSALGIALLRHLIRQTRLTFASTHHGELKALKYMDTEGRFENASMEFDDEKMKPTFRLVWGIPGRSNALAIAKRLGLSPTIIDAAKDALSGTSVEDVNQVISALEGQRLEAEQHTAQVKETLARTKELEAEAERKLTQLEKSEQELKKAKQESIEADLARAQGEIANVVRKMQQQGTSQAAAAAREELGDMKSKTGSRKTNLAGKEVSEVGLYGAPQVGDYVTISRLGERPVQVLDYSPGRSEMLVGFGAMKVKVLVTEITSRDETAAKEEESARRAARARLEYAERNDENVPKRAAIRHAANTCDVRGLTVDEALPKIDDIVAEGIRHGCCWVIHGFGPAGKLRKGVRDHLRRHPNVDSIEDADQYDGGAGATVVRVK